MYCSTQSPACTKAIKHMQRPIGDGHDNIAQFEHMTQFGIVQTKPYADTIIICTFGVRSPKHLNVRERMQWLSYINNCTADLNAEASQAHKAREHYLGHLTMHMFWINVAISDNKVAEGTNLNF